ncbi:radical SAM protein [Candidatus Woesearchaeota archaeon]|nr:radical SAM protein [Candidatus Woesearchaeota archaeon]
MRVTLINPKLDYRRLGSPNRVFQPLDLLILSSLLVEHGCKTQVIDANAQGISCSSGYWSSLTADAVVLTTASLDRWQCPVVDVRPLLPMIYQLAHTVSRVYLIGPHAKQLAKIDLPDECEIIAPPSEPEVLSRIMSRKLRKDPLSIVPDYAAVDMSKYSFALLPGKFSLMEVSRGCGASCFFCNKRVMYAGNHRYKPRDTYLKEFAQLQRRRVQTIYFIDLDFPVSTTYFDVLVKDIADYNFSWTIQVRASLLTEAILEKLSRAGCKLVQIGIETPYKNAKLPKTLSLRSYCSLIDAARKYEVETLGFYIYSDEEKFFPFLDHMLRIGSTYASILPLVNYHIFEAPTTRNLIAARLLTLLYSLRPSFIYYIARTKDVVFWFRNLWRNFLQIQ